MPKETKKNKNKETKNKDKKAQEQKEFEEYKKSLIEYIVDNDIFDSDDTEAELETEIILYLLSIYREKCLIRTIIDVDDLWENFEKSYEPKDRKTQEDHNKYCDTLSEHIYDTWNKKYPVKDVEETKANIQSFLLLLTNYGCIATIKIVMDINKLWEEFDEKED